MPDLLFQIYEDDYRFERIWRNPRQYLNVLKRYNGVILPDFSLYRDMPLVMQLWNIYRSRAIGFWLQLNGIKVIVNIRFADKRTYRYCCDGVAKHCVIALGTHGTLKNKEDRRYFVKDLLQLLNGWSLQQLSFMAVLRRIFSVLIRRQASRSSSFQVIIPFLTRRWDNGSRDSWGLW